MFVSKYCVFVRLFEFETKRDGWWWLNFFLVVVAGFFIYLCGGVLSNTDLVRGENTYMRRYKFRIRML